MNEVAQQYIDSLESKVEKKYSQQLLDAGIYKKEYNETQNEEFPYEEIYFENSEGNSIKKTRYYKKLMLQVNSEEYDRIITLNEKLNGEVIENNRYDKIFNALGIIIMIVGFFLGFIISGDKYGSFNFGIAAICWASCIVSGLVFLGFGNIIKLLYGIYRKKQ